MMLRRGCAPPALLYNISSGDENSSWFSSKSARLEGTYA
jgi:hypothetical protein